MNCSRWPPFLAGAGSESKEAMKPKATFTGTNTQVIQRLRARVKRLEKSKDKDEEEMTTRGKEIVKFSNIVRGCEDLIERHVHDKLMLIIVGFEKRCELHTKRRKKND